MKYIHSRDNAQFKALRRLAESARERKSTGQTLIDGVHLIEASEAAGLPVKQLIISESGLTRREIAALAGERDGLVLADALYREVAVVETPSGVMATIDTPSASPPDCAADAMLLDGVQDPGNVGTLMRTAAAAGIRQVLLSADCAGAWSPKVLRAGQGAHFLLNVIEEADLAAFAGDFRGAVAATTLEAATALYDCDLRVPIAWIFGSEGQGVRPALLSLAGLRVHIPMAGAVESLNVGAAAAVCLFETLRQRQAAG